MNLYMYLSFTLMLCTQPQGGKVKGSEAFNAMLFVDAALELEEEALHDYDSSHGPKCMLTIF